MAAVYQQAKREHPARQVEIAVSRESARSRTLASLPSGIQLRPGELRLAFTGFEDLLTKLFELSQALQNDLETFSDFLENEG